MIGKDDSGSASADVCLIAYSSRWVSLYLGRRTGWVRVPGERGAGLQYKSPADRPLFSERHGYDQVVAKACGWRLIWFREDRGGKGTV